MKAPEPIYTLPEAAAAAGVEYRTLHSWAEAGLLKLGKPAKGSGRPAHVSQHEVELCMMLARLRRAGCELSILKIAARSFDSLRDRQRVIRLVLPGGVQLSVPLGPEAVE
jgi:DNA-binding transcriptional MerR regulator